MDVVLIPGFWLGGPSWSEVTPTLRAAGLTVYTPTLQGLDSRSDDRAGITLRDHVDELVAIIDGLATPDPDDPDGEDPRDVVLVGHSGGGAVVHAAVDARPTRIARAIYVDSGPLPHGVPINDGLTSAGDEIPLPPWEKFSEADLRGLGELHRAHFRAIAVPTPARVARDPQQLRNPQRFTVPITLISCTYSKEEIDGAITAGVPYFAEIPEMDHTTVVELPTGHWPQFTRPTDLAVAIVDAVRAT